MTYGEATGEGEIWEMVVKHPVMEDKLMVPLPPVIADSFILVNDECLNTQHFKPSTDCKASLSSSYSRCKFCSSTNLPNGDTCLLLERLVLHSQTRFQHPFYPSSSALIF